MLLEFEQEFEQEFELIKQINEDELEDGPQKQMKNNSL